ncbi:FAD-dependent oxidoreductase [Kovacikia minuta CCNUW1]|uniref:NAD(P)/FAD-dependent oxidoreductase n=1 Tax=Kovacikia minuta TaxID=2931930 RepID=UPI001CC8ED8F|nr:FAD-dependent oxidoreductase [Kovacikia minuta]UBF26754.1 FAD-dependent oxidoreductase [Kovacikia minuta CCNUW1]
MSESSSQFDIAVIGAGMAGLTCARQLQETGYRVIVLEKSRGIGGRMATRRLQGTFADHGACYLTPKGDRFRNLIHQLIQAGVLHIWTDTVDEMGADGNLRLPAPDNRYPRYVAPKGMTAIAKFLATDLEIRLNQRVHTLELTENHLWRLVGEMTHSALQDHQPFTDVFAKAVVLAVPAPQAGMLLQSLPETVLDSAFIDRLNSISFAPCLSAIAGYAPAQAQDWLTGYPHLRAVTFSLHPAIAWLGLDSSKRTEPSPPVVVVQSTASFATRYLEAIDLQPAGYQLLQQAAAQLPFSWLANPDWLQVHRWRYAFAQHPLSETCLPAPTPIPLVCAGDWCGGMKVEDAFLSGLAAAAHLNKAQN